MRFCILLLLALSAQGSLAWTSTTWSSRSHKIMRSTSVLALHQTTPDRRAFLAAAAGVLLSTTSIATPPAFAEGTTFDDLAMPTEAESKKNEDDEMAERLRRKAELQKKASRPVTFADSLKGEKEKQKELQKSKEERRNAMCEELGRGC